MGSSSLPTFWDDTHMDISDSLGKIMLFLTSDGQQHSFLQFIIHLHTRLYFILTLQSAQRSFLSAWLEMMSLPFLGLYDILASKEMLIHFLFLSCFNFSFPRQQCYKFVVGTIGLFKGKKRKKYFFPIWVCYVKVKVYLLSSI